MDIEDNFLRYSFEKPKDFNYVYFIESHKTSQYTKLFASNKKNIGIGIIESAKKLKKSDFDINIYKFRIYPQSIIDKYKDISKLEITIKLEDRQNDTFDNNITNINLFEDNFLYDLKFESTKIFNKKQPPVQLNLTHKEQFKIYVDYLRKTLNIPKESKENDYLISSIQNLFDKKEEKYDFSFYLLVFVECSSPEDYQRQLIFFDPEKLNGIGDLEEEELINISICLNSLEINPYTIIYNIEDDDIRNEYLLKLYSLIFYFNYCFYKERLTELLNNDMLQNFIFKGLYINKKLYSNLILSKDETQKLIKSQTNFEELSWALQFDNDFLEILDLININLDTFNNEFNIEKQKYENINNNKLNNELYPTIDIGNNIKPKQEDNLDGIYMIMSFLFQLIIDKAKFFYLKINPKLFEGYIKLFEGNDLNKLLKIKEMIKLMSQYISNYKINIDINKTIHDTGIELILNGKMSNEQILVFLLKDTFWKGNTNLDEKFFNIFEKIDINLIDKKFLIEWKKFKFYELFKNQELNFLMKTSNIVKDLKDFQLLYKLLYSDDSNSNITYDYNLILILQKKYFELYKETYVKEKCPNFIKDSCDLIYFSDRKFVKIEIFLMDLQQNLPKNLVNEIFNEFLERTINISKIAQKIISNYFLNQAENLIDNLPPLFLSCPCYSKTIAPYFNNYLIQMNEIFLIEESNNFKLLRKMLTNNAFFSKKDILKDYYNYNTILMDLIKSKIENYEIIYKDIDHFYENEENKKIFNERLLIIFLNDKNKAEEKMKLISEIYNKSKTNINNLEILIEDQKFFNLKNYINIEEVEKLIEDIKNSNLDFFQKEPSSIDKYSEKIEQSKKRIYKRKSKIFMTLYEKEKQINKNEENKIIEQCDIKINKLLNILNNKNESIDKDISDFIISLNLNSDEIKNEIDILFKVFDGEKDKNKMIDSLVFIYNKEKLLKILMAINNIIECAQVKKGELFSLIKAMNSHIEKSDGNNVINFSIKILKNYYIDFSVENKLFIDLLINLSEFPEKIKLLFNITNENYEKAKQTLKNITNINDFEEIFKFLKAINAEDNFTVMEDKQLVKKMREEVNKNGNIISSINNFFSFFKEIENCIMLKN